MYKLVALPASQPANSVKPLKAGINDTNQRKRRVNQLTQVHLQKWPLNTVWTQLLTGNWMTAN